MKKNCPKKFLVIASPGCGYGGQWKTVGVDAGEITI
jgi:hypothetical protein